MHHQQIDDLYKRMRKLEERMDELWREHCRKPRLVMIDKFKEHKDVDATKK